MTFSHKNWFAIEASLQINYFKPCTVFCCCTDQRSINLMRERWIVKENAIFGCSALLPSTLLFYQNVNVMVAKFSKEAHLSTPQTHWFLYTLWKNSIYSKIYDIVPYIWTEVAGKNVQKLDLDVSQIFYPNLLDKIYLPEKLLFNTTL